MSSPIFTYPSADEFRTTLSECIANSAYRYEITELYDDQIEGCWCWTIKGLDSGVVVDANVYENGMLLSVNNGPFPDICFPEVSVRELVLALFHDGLLRESDSQFLRYTLMVDGQTFKTLLQSKRSGFRAALAEGFRNLFPPRFDSIEAIRL